MQVLEESFCSLSYWSVFQSQVMSIPLGLVVLGLYYASILVYVV